MTPSHFELAPRYFSYLARQFPVMCASDEFHFLPQATDAGLYYDRMESLSAEQINTAIHDLKQYRLEFERLLTGPNDLESQTDLQLLIANITGLLIELETNRS